MMQIFYLFRFCIILSVLLLPSFLKANVEFTVEEFTLSNGLRVVLIPNHKVPAVAHMLWYKIGAKDEPPGQSGVAHFLEHLMFKGTEKVGKGEFSKIIARHGGNENAFTGHDYTTYFQNIAVEHLPLVMRLEADRMRNVIFVEEEILKERDVVIEERRLRVENKPRFQLIEQMNQQLYPDYPYGIPVIGWKKEIAGLTLENARSFYHSYYTPSNAILIVSGDITKDALLPLVQTYYGTIPSGEKPIPPLPTTLAAPNDNTVTLKDKNVTAPYWLRFYQAPSFVTGDTHHSLALQLLAYILGGDTGILYQSLVIEQNLAAFVDVSYEGLSKGFSRFAIQIIPNPGVSMDIITKAANNLIDSLLENGLDPSTLSHAKTALKAELIYAQEGFRTLGYLYGQALAIGLPIEFINQWPDAIEKVTEIELQEAALSTLKTERSVTGLLLPQEQGS